MGVVVGTASLGGIANIVGTDIPVVAGSVIGGPPADAVGTGIIGRAVDIIIAGFLIGGVDTSIFRIARVVRAQVSVVAV